MTRHLSRRLLADLATHNSAPVQDEDPIASLHSDASDISTLTDPMAVVRAATGHPTPDDTIRILNDAWALARLATYWTNNPPPIHFGSTTNDDLARLLRATGIRRDLGQPPLVGSSNLFEAARAGFTIEQAGEILASEHLLSHLKRHWELHGPTQAVLHLSEALDTAGAIHRELLIRCGQLLAARTKSTYALGASTGTAPELLSDGNGSEDRTLVIRRLFHDDGVMDIAIESSTVDANETFPVVALLCLAANKTPRRLLFLLIPDDEGTQTRSYAESRVPIGPDLTTEILFLYNRPVQASDLKGEALEAVSDSVAAAKLPWKDAWRRAALSTPTGHPLRDEVAKGLSQP
jgi:hypothetical protein